MKLRLPKLLLLAVVAAGVSNVYAANGWIDESNVGFGLIYYIDHENAQVIDATGKSHTTWEIWSDNKANNPTGSTITSLKLKTGDTASVALEKWDGNRHFDTITFEDVSVTDNGTAILNINQGHKAAIINVSGGTISSTVNGSLSVTGQVAMDTLTLNGSLTNKGTLSTNSLTFGGYTINNDGGTITINTSIALGSLDKTSLDGSFSEDEHNGFFTGSHVLISGGTINISQDILDADPKLNYDTEAQKLTYSTGKTSTTYYLNTVEREYDASDSWSGATGFIIGKQGTLKLSAALADGMTDGITVSETGATIKIEQGLTFDHNSVSIESDQKVSYKLDGSTLDLSKGSAVLDISSIDMKNGALVKLDKASDSLGSTNSAVQINMSGGSTLKLQNGYSGKIYADISVDGSAKILGCWQGNNLNIIGTINGTGELELGRSGNDHNNSWTISATISDKSSEEKLAITANTGCVILSGNNSYSGGTTITGGTLKATHANALGTGNVTVNGGNLEISGENAVKGAELNITNGKVTATFSGSGDSVIKKSSTVNINTGGTLLLQGHDMLGWGSSDDSTKINLSSDSSDNKATLQIKDTGSLTLGSTINMNGNAQITGDKFNTFGTTLTVTGTGNEVSVGTIEMRTQAKRSWDVDVAKGGELTLSCKLTNYSNEAATLNKSNEGKLIVTGTESTWTGLMNVTGGTLQLKDNATLGDASIMIGSAATLEAGKGTINSLTLSNGATLKADAAVNMGGALTLGTNLTLNGSLLTALNSLTAGQTIDLFTGVESLTLGKDTYAKGTVLDEASGIDLSIYFTLPTTYTAAVYNAEAFGNSYYLGYNADGTIYAGMAAIPEPTTATLSLLALAALASRRRRK